MMTELAHLQSELEDSVERLRELDPIFTLLLEQLPDQPDQLWHRRITWLAAELRSTADCELDQLQGFTLGLKRFQTTLSREVDQ